jgi:hypothetical protein
LVLPVSNVSPGIGKLIGRTKAHDSHWNRYFRIVIIACMQILNFGLGCVCVCVCGHVRVYAKCSDMFKCNRQTRKKWIVVSTLRQAVSSQIFAQNCLNEKKQNSVAVKPGMIKCNA